MGRRVVPIMDAFHREWNDTSNALRQTGLWLLIHLPQACFNLPDGPWDGSRWRQEMSDAVVAPVQTDGCSGPLWL
eukprot:11184972-Lingulodinium_polyedra.AAC.1